YGGPLTVHKQTPRNPEPGSRRRRPGTSRPRPSRKPKTATTHRRRVSTSSTDDAAVVPPPVVSRRSQGSLLNHRHSKGSLLHHRPSSARSSTTAQQGSRQARPTTPPSYPTGRLAKLDRRRRRTPPG